MASTDEKLVYKASRLIEETDARGGKGMSPEICREQAAIRRAAYQRFLGGCDEGEEEIVFCLVWLLPLGVGTLICLTTRLQVIMESPLSFLVGISWVLFCESVAFCLMHVHFHALMYHEQGGDHNDIPPRVSAGKPLTTVPFAYYHHYVDWQMYGKVPLAYQNRFSKFGLIILAVCLILGCSLELSIVWIASLAIDAATHSWYHTRSTAYTSWRITSSKFVGIDFLYRAMSRLGMVSREDHWKHHQSSALYEQSRTNHWLDFRVYAWCGLDKPVEWLGDRWFTFLRSRPGGGGLTETIVAVVLTIILSLVAGPLPFDNSGRVWSFVVLVLMWLVSKRVTDENPVGVCYVDPLVRWLKWHLTRLFSDRLPKNCP